MSTLYNKIVLSNDDWLHLSEFELYDTNGTNIALLGTASQTTTFQTSVASISINGLNDGTVVGDTIYNFSSTQGAGDWTLILDQPYLRSDLSHIKAYNRVTTSQSEKDRAIGITITLYSVDDTVSEQIGVFNGDEIQTFVITVEGISDIVEGILSCSLKVFPVAGATNYTLSYQSSSEPETFVTGVDSAVSLEEEINIVTTTHSIVYTLTLYVDGVSFHTKTFTPLTDEIPSYVTNGAVLHFDANNPASFTEGTEVLTDLLGSTNTLYTMAGIPAVLNGGGLDFSDGLNELETTESFTFQSFSLWTVKTQNIFGNPLFIQPTGYIISRDLGQAASGAGNFFGGVVVYIDGVLSDLNTYNNLPNGELHNIYFVNSSPATGIVTINGSGAGSPQYTNKSIFHSVIFYNRSLSAEEILQNFSSGSGSGTVAPFSVVPGIVNLYSTISAVDDATAYKITIQEYGSSIESIAYTNIDPTDLIKTIGSLSPQTTYTLRLYVSIGSGYTLASELTSTTLENLASNHNKGRYGADGEFDFRNVDQTTLSTLDGVMNELFQTGDELSFKIRGSSVQSKFVKLGGTVVLENESAISIPFSTSSGTGQNATITLSDNVDVVLAYDETTEEISINGVSYAFGESLVLDGKKVTFHDV